MNNDFPSHIFLTGFMGCGKTSLGRNLAALMKRGFVDTDEMVSNMAGKSPSDIFREEGEPAFRKLESEALRLIISQHNRHVIALGGGTICEQKNLDLVLKSGFLIYIQLPAEVLAERLEPDTSTRPVLQGKQGEQLLDTIDKKLRERESYYEKASLTVNGIHLEAAHLYQIISAALPKTDT